SNCGYKPQIARVERIVESLRVTRPHVLLLFDTGTDLIRPHGRGVLGLSERSDTNPQRVYQLIPVLLCETWHQSLKLLVMNDAATPAPPTIALPPMMRSSPSLKCDMTPRSNIENISPRPSTTSP